MREISIKICGLTQEKDISAAISLGIDFLGFVLVKGSSRYVRIDRLKKLLKEIPSTIRTVALLVDPENDILETIINEVNIDFLQLHGQESPERVLEISKEIKVPIIKAIGIKRKDDIKKIKKEVENIHPLLENIVNKERISESISRLNGKNEITNFEVTSLLGFVSANRWLRNNKKIH